MLSGKGRDQTVNFAIIYQHLYALQNGMIEFPDSFVHQIMWACFHSLNAFDQWQLELLEIELVIPRWWESYNSVLMLGYLPEAVG